MTVTIESTRFGALDIPAEEVLDFPTGLIGLAGTRWALLAKSEDAAFAWLHSIDDPSLAIPVTNPWRFFADYEVALSDSETARLGMADQQQTSVWVTVRAAGELTDFSANLAAPILIHEGIGHQVINQADGVPVRAPLFDSIPEAQPEVA